MQTKALNSTLKMAYCPEKLDILKTIGRFITIFNPKPDLQKTDWCTKFPNLNFNIFKVILFTKT